MYFSFASISSMVCGRHPLPILLGMPSRSSVAAIAELPAPSMYISKMRCTTAASSGTISSVLSSNILYPYMPLPMLIQPFSNLRLNDHRCRSESTLRSSSAIVAATVSISSLVGSLDRMFSFSNTTSTPMSRSSRTASSSSIVFRATRDTDFVYRMSNLPARASRIIASSCGLLSMLLPLIPRSA